MKEVRLNRLTQLVQRVASEVLIYELKDPRMGFVTVSRVKLTNDMRHAVIYWSVVGPESDRSRTAHALEHAKGYIQSRIAKALTTRVTPAIRFEYDASVEGSIRISQILAEVGVRPDDDGETGASEEE